MRTPAERLKLAEELGSRAAPMPTRDPVHAGLAVASIAGLAIAAFAGLARGAVGWPVVIVVGIAYLLPFAYYKQQENAHHRAVAREYEALKREDEA